MQFWHLAEVLLHNDDPGSGPKNCEYELVGSRRIDGNEVPVDKIGEANMVMITLAFFFGHCSIVGCELDNCHAILLFYDVVIVIIIFFPSTI